MVKALRSCLEAAKGKIKAGHLILRKSPKRTATGSSTASNISRIPIRHADMVLQCRIYSLLVPGILESRMSQETASVLGNSYRIFYSLKYIPYTRGYVGSISISAERILK